MTSTLTQTAYRHPATNREHPLQQIQIEHLLVRPRVIRSIYINSVTTIPKMKSAPIRSIEANGFFSPALSLKLVACITELPAKTPHAATPIRTSERI